MPIGLGKAHRVLRNLLTVEESLNMIHTIDTREELLEFLSENDGIKYMAQVIHCGCSLKCLKFWDILRII